MIKALASAGLALAIAAPAMAQTLNMMRSIDAPHYDAQRTTWAPTADIVNMFQDTLVALDWDGKAPVPYLAKSWTVSGDGKLCLVTNKKLKGARPHMLYANTFYNGLDLSF